MDMKCIMIQLLKQQLNLYKGEEIKMLKLLSKMAEKAAKNTNTACFAYWVMHQPKMPASMIKKT